MLFFLLLAFTVVNGCSRRQNAAQVPPATQPKQVAPSLGVAVPVLYYHLIDDNLYSPFHSMFVSPPDFANQMKYLKTAGYTVIPLAQIENAGEYSKPVIITFDDGYEDNYTNAYPILKEYNFPATVFLISGFIGKPGYLNNNEILQMQDLVSFQDHTVTHRSLATLSAAEQEYELSASKQAIETLTGQNVFAVAYPNGSVQPDDHRDSQTTRLQVCLSNGARRYLSYRRRSLHHQARQYTEGPEPEWFYQEDPGAVDLNRRWIIGKPCR